MNTGWNRYDAHIGTNNINDGTTMTTTGGWGCLSQSQEASKRVRKDGMAMVFSFFSILYPPHSFIHFTFYVLCWLACPYFCLQAGRKDRMDRVGKRGRQVSCLYLACSRQMRDSVTN